MWLLLVIGSSELIEITSWLVSAYDFYSRVVNNHNERARPYKRTNHEVICLLGTPPYWQKFMYEVVAMVKQLRIPTWFMTLSCADLRWPELFQIIARTRGMNMSDQEVNALSYNIC